VHKTSDGNPYMVERLALSILESKIQPSQLLTSADELVGHRSSGSSRVDQM
jgi:hypothetical protein